MRKMANQTMDLPISIKDERARIDKQNAMLDRKLMSVKSNIPMNSHVRNAQSLLMDNYRRFASKYNG